MIVFAIVMVVYQQVENYIAADDHRKAAQVSGREADQESAYGHLMPGSEAEARDRLNDYLER